MKKAIKGLKNLQVMVAAVFLFIFLMTVVIQMATRFMGIAATWTEDVSMYSFIWAVFMGELRWLMTSVTSHSPLSMTS